MALENSILKLYNGAEGKPGLMKTRELADYLNVSDDWVYHNLGQIPHYKIGRNIRFRREEIEEWLSSQGRQSDGFDEENEQKGYSVVDRRVREWKEVQKNNRKQGRRGKGVG